MLHYRIFCLISRIRLSSFYSQQASSKSWFIAVKGKNSDTSFAIQSKWHNSTSWPHNELDIQGECVSPVLSLQNTLHCEIG